jgi:hypothetical protein
VCVNSVLAIHREMSATDERLEELDGIVIFKSLYPLTVICSDQTLLENTNKLLAHVGISAKKIISIDELIRVHILEPFHH